MPQIVRKHQIVQARERKPPKKAGYSSAHALRAVRWMQKNLVFVQGRWSLQPFTFIDWQLKLTKAIFGTIDKRGLRQYRIAYIEVPRGAGKTNLVASIGNYLLWEDHEPNGQILVAASDRAQGSILFDISKQQVWANPKLEAKCKQYRQQLRNLDDGSELRVLSSDAHRAHGLAPSGALCDELHAWKGRELYDAIQTGTGKREQPLVIIITTAGNDRESVCFELHEYAQKVIDGIVEDPSFFPLIFTAPLELAWDSEEAFAAANPSYGHTVFRDYYQREVRRAREIPAYRASYEQLFLNRWQELASVWIQLEKWDACQQPMPTNETLQATIGSAALDLSMTTDLSALAMAWPLVDQTVALRWHFWLPEARAETLEAADRVPYRRWAQEGLLTLTPGDVVDYEFIRLHLGKLRAAGYRFRDIALDRWNATALATRLVEDGFAVRAHGQGFKDMSPAAKAWESMILQRRIRHGGNPVMRWQVTNAGIEVDAADNIKPTKVQGKKRKKIDGVVSGIMALGGALAAPQVGDWKIEAW